MSYLKSQSGTYALLMKLPGRRVIRIGRRGDGVFPQGYYTYIGSAFGSGGVCARLGRHLVHTKKMHWHIDYLREHVEIIAIWCTYDPLQREHQWSASFQQMASASTPFSRFGASDCKCPSHLFLTHSVPDVRLFYERLKILDPKHEPILVYKHES